MSNFVHRRHVLATALVVAAAALSGCGTQGGLEDKTGSFLVTPGKYVLYSCPQLAVRQDVLMTRKRELDALIAKAGPGSGGALAATLAYRGEHTQVTGDLTELAKENAAKNCPPPPPKPAAVSSPPKPKKGKPTRG